MDSPESTIPAPAAPNAAVVSPSGVQESPFFAYVSNLSPIKLSSDVCVPSAIRELSFPSPSPVFTSPHINPVRKDKFLKRSQRLSPESGKFSLGYTGDIRELLEKTSHYGGANSQPIMVPCSTSTTCEHPTRLQSCSSPSDCVDEFFADPVEDSVNSSALSDFCLDQAIELGQPSQSGFASPNKTPKDEPVQFQDCSSSGCIDEILPCQEGDRKANDSFDKFPVVDVVSNSSAEASKEFYPQVGNIKNDELEIVESPAMACQAGENPELGISLIQKNCDQNKDSINVADDGREKNDGQLIPCTKLVAQNAMKYSPSKILASDLHGFQLAGGHTANSDISVVPESVEDDSRFSKKEKSTIPLDCSDGDYVVLTERVQSMEGDSNSQMQPKSLDVALPDERQLCTSTSLCSTSMNIGVSNEQACLSSKPQWEGCQLAYAMRRRLEFMHSAGPGTNLESTRNPCNIDERILIAESPSSSLGLETRNASQNESVGASGNVLVYSSPELSHFQKNPDPSAHALCEAPLCQHQTAEANANRFDLSIQKNGSSSATDPRPAGIGLHLNSVVHAVAKDCDINMQLVDRDLGKDSLTTQLGKELCSSDQNIDDSKGCLPSTSLTSSVSVQTDVNSHSALVCSSNDKSECDQQKNLDVTAPDYSLSLQYALITDPLEICLPPTFVSQVVSPCNVKRTPVGPSISEELNEMSPKKKSKKAPENDGCKRCNCKKSKCLKLYCDCFAAGVYCTDACTCQGCLNRPDYVDTVLETRQQIETRNPLAFAPKVVVHDAAASRAYGDDDKHTPASARHKRGCNCKRSQCLKKYCECFQSKVGCSLGCRCEGCKNSYGTKDGAGNSEIEHRKASSAKCERSVFVIADEEDAQNEMPKIGRPLRLSPFTPTVEGSYGTNVPKSQFPARKHLSSSPESASRGWFSRARERNAQDEAEAGGFSPRWDRFGDICSLSPLTSASPGDPPERRKKPALRGGTSPAFQRCSPITPAPNLGQPRCALESCSDGGPPDAQEDDTPEILRDDCAAPHKGPKARSPNKKRVSPPHKYPDEMIPGSSRSGKLRKFVLRSMPSFPSLTPYSNASKGHGT